MGQIKGEYVTNMTGPDQVRIVSVTNTIDVTPGEHIELGRLDFLRIDKGHSFEMVEQTSPRSLIRKLLGART